jgi:glycerol-3-phosphate acyltransferase PlsY
MGCWHYILPIVAYLYGAVPFGFLAARALRGVDIREVGSGNIGATNAARVLGFRYFPAIFALDVSKGALPVLIALLIAPAGSYDPPLLAVVSGVAAILGHVFPLYLGFKGGKAVATSTGVFIMLFWQAVVVAAVIWVVVFVAWRYVSLASILGALAMPIAVYVLHEDPVGTGFFLTALSCLGSVFVIYLHRGNMRRLLAGTEHRIGSGHQKSRD